jgi:hypothetical protein
MTDEKKMAALQKHLEELESEPTEVLAERYGLTPSDLGAFGRVMQKVYNKMAPELVDKPILDEYPDPVRFDWSGPVTDSPSALYELERDVREAASKQFGRKGALRKAEELRQRPPDADEMLDKLRRENQTSLGDK